MTSTKQDYIDKLLKYPEKFREAACKGQWAKAKYLYDTAIRVAEFLDVTPDIRRQLFEDREVDDEEIPAMFPKELVSKAYEQCCVNLYQGYEHESYRRYGQPPQYYPQPRYPVPGYQKE